MALTTLDPRTALIVIDLQKGIAAGPVAHPVADIVDKARRLAEAFRRHDLPVIIVNVAGGAPGRNEQPPRSTPLPADFIEILPELGALPSDIYVTKRTWGAFASTDIKEQLDALGITQVVMLGISTSIGVESTARQAFESGFNVTLAIDAMTDRVAEAHTNSIARIFPRLGETGTTAEILDLLEKTRA